jgi:threonine/homoserine/homoserine lactone efflux protein
LAPGSSSLFGLSNPKMAMFFLAFFTQFTRPAHGSSAEQILVLGAVFWVIGVIRDFGIARASDSIGAWLHNQPRIDAAKPRVEGATYLALARSAAISGA